MVKLLNFSTAKYVKKNKNCVKYNHIIYVLNNYI